MNVRRTLQLVAVSFGLAGVLTASSQDAVAAAAFDHLECYKFQVAKKLWNVSPHAFDQLTLDSMFFGQESGCVLLPTKRPRPRELCVAVQKTPNTQPGPSLDGPVFYACYNMRCPSQLDIEIQDGLFLNQFGEGPAKIKRQPTSRRLCVPTGLALPLP